MAANNYSIVQTVENGEVLLSVLPSRWVVKNGWKQEAQGDGYDLCFWPKGVSGYRLLEKAKKDPKIPADNKVLRAYRCKIKRINFSMYTEAFRELKIMEIQSDTDEYEPRKKLSKSTTAADLFKQIQSRSGPLPGPSFSLPRSPSSMDFAHNQEYDDDEDTSDLDESNSKPAGKVGEVAADLPESNSGSESKILVTQNTVFEQSNMLQLVLSLHEKVDNNTKQVENCVDIMKQFNNRNTALLSQINAKLDVIATQTPQVGQGQLESFEIKKIPLNPVKCLADMESLEEKSKNDLFVRSVIQFLGSMHGKQRYVGEGWTVCLQVVNYFFDREFLMSCSWSGISRNKNNENVISKIPFHKYSGIINMFHRVVQFSDPTFSRIQCEQFLHRCLRNARQRFEETKGTRASVARKRSKPKHQPQEDEDEDSNIIVQEFVIEQGPDHAQSAIQLGNGDTGEGVQIILEEFLAAE